MSGSILARGPNFERARTQASTPFSYVDLDLSTAKSNYVLPLAGDFIYFDSDPGGSVLAGGASLAGFVVVELNNESADPVAPFLAQPGFALEAVFSKVKLSWPAQAGKKARLMYSTGERVAPTNSVSLSGTVNLGNQFVTPYGDAYKSTTLLAANTPDVVFLPANNVNGAIVWGVMHSALAAAGVNHSSYVAKTAPPANAIDGDVIVCGMFSTAMAPPLVLPNPVRIGAGKGLYRISDGAEGQVISSCLYTLL